jgi:hypothetical protein
MVIDAIRDHKPEKEKRKMRKYRHWQIIALLPSTGENCTLVVAEITASGTFRRCFSCWRRRRSNSLFPPDML